MVRKGNSIVPITLEIVLVSSTRVDVKRCRRLMSSHSFLSW